MASKVERVKILLAANSDLVLQKCLKKRCSEDIFFWFDWFAQTFDPRLIDQFDVAAGEMKRVPIGVVPFNLYPFQRDFISALELNAKKNCDTAVEKSRDQGVSWAVICWCYWNWLFTPNAQFLIGSMTADDVDIGEHEASIFGKIRILVKYTPPWMMPKGFRDDMHNTFMKLLNPENGSKIKGRAPVPNFGRSGRYMAIIFDEAAFWRDFASSWASCGSVTSASRIAISTPNGREFFYKLITGAAQEQIHRITMPWHLNPQHTQEWYNETKKRYAPAKFAREIEISYSESLEGRVFQYNPAIHNVPGEYEFNRELKTIVAFDFGNCSAVTFHQLTPWGQLRTFKEIVFSTKGETHNLAAAASHYLSTLNLKPSDVLCCADPSGNTKNNQTGFSECDILRSPYNFSVRTDRISAIQARRKVGVSLLQTMMGTLVQGAPRWQVWGDKCPTIIEALQGEYRYATSDAGDESNHIVEEHPWEDVIDTCRYAGLQFADYEVNTRKEIITSSTIRFAI